MMKKDMKKIFSIILASLSLVSCVDTVILPDDMTVEEDFWKRKSDVEQSVNGAYDAMAQAAVQQRLVVWNMRSDEYTINSTLNNRALNQIYTANIQTDNTYNDWAAFYTVINRCNLVIARSAQVMDNDPNYQEGDHNSNVAQMKALRALCYFTLVKAFRDVPMILEPVTESSADMNVSKVAPAVIIEQIIADLENAKGNSLSAQNLSGDEKTSRFNKDAVLALLADVYLWKGSVMGDADAYAKCIQCCEEIHNNRTVGKSVRTRELVTFDDDDYFLNTYRNYYNVFANTRNQENILTLLFNDNVALCNMYYKYKNASNALPQIYTNSVYATVGPSVVFADDADARGNEGVFSFKTAPDAGASIRKFVATSGLIDSSKPEAGTGRDYTPYATGWNLYRISDIMLMRAEAMVQLGRLMLKEKSQLVDALNESSTLQDSLNVANEIQPVVEKVSDYYVKAARMAQIVNMRAHTDQANHLGVDSTSYRFAHEEPVPTFDFARKWINNFKNQIQPKETNDLELIILKEKAREICFEGKRWADMLRFNYRHMENVNYNVMLHEQGGDASFAKNTQAFLDLIQRKYSGSAGAAVVARMPSEPYLYMPVRKGECEVNPALKQNPVYKDSGEAEKNY